MKDNDTCGQLQLKIKVKQMIGRLLYIFAYLSRTQDLDPHKMKNVDLNHC